MNGSTHPDAARAWRSPAGTESIAAWLDDPHTGPEQVLRLLRDATTPSDVLRRIGLTRRWTRTRDVRRALVDHAKTPLAVSRALLPFLYRNDLVELAWNLRAHPALRRQARRLLAQRVEEMTLGERVSLARRATAEVIASLMARPHPQVLRGLLDNRRLTEAHAVEIAASPNADGPLLEYLATCSEWRRRPPVVRALLANRRTPVGAALRLIGRLPARQLQVTADDAALPRIVRIGASRRLQESAQRRKAAR